MRLLYSTLVPALTLTVLSPQAFAEAPTDFELGLEGVIVITPISDDQNAAQSQTMLGEFSLTAEAEKLLDNGTRLRFRTALRSQIDHPQRPGGSGEFGNASGEPMGAFSAIGTGTPLDQPALRSRLETAYVQIDGGYGELRVGKDRGVAARFHEGAPGVLSHARLDSALLDPSGLSLLRTRHDLTGPSAKLSYATPRLLGLRAGVSFTPDANADGLDRRIRLAEGDVSNTVEVALNGSRYIRDQDLRLEGSLGWSRGTLEASAPSPLYRDTVETWSAGIRLERHDWTAGISWLKSDDGLLAGDYEAWSAGLSRQLGNLALALSYGETEIASPRPNARSWRVGGAFPISQTAGIGLAYYSEELKGSPFRSKSEGIVVEITLSTQIFGFSEN